MIVGILLYYALAIEKTLLSVLGDISPEQSKSTKNIYSKVLQFLNYICTHPLAIIEYHSSEIILHVSSYASYNLVSKGRSRASGVHYLSDNHPPCYQYTLNFSGQFYHRSSKISCQMPFTFLLDLSVGYTCCSRIVYLNRCGWLGTLYFLQCCPNWD